MSLYGNVVRTIRYIKRCGISAAADAVMERLEQKRIKYDYEAPGEEELNQQRGKRYERPLRFSILVPAYETPEIFMQDLILSVEEQSYTDYELIIGDASPSERVKAVVLDHNSQYGNIRYIHLDENQGISGNTNAIIPEAEGDYLLLLDHDDVLAPDALYRLREEIDKGEEPVLVFTDEDKVDSELEKYSEPNRKQGFDAEMLYTNNYICHLSAFRKDVISELLLRAAYDGAQDHDLLLRTVAWAREHYGEKEYRRYIRHVPRVLYHWRCHSSSTADNPSSKDYAYRAGKRAVEDALKTRGINVKVSDTKHLGFFHVDYGEEVFMLRPDIGVVGGAVYELRHISGGCMTADGKVLYEGLKQGYSGIMHRASIQQEAVAVDIRNMKIREELVELYQKVTGLSYPYTPEQKLTEEQIRSKSLRFCEKVREKGLLILYDPELKRQ